MVESYPFIVPSGSLIQPYYSGQSAIGTISHPFGNIYASAIYISGIAVNPSGGGTGSGTYSGGPVTSDITPTSSGTLSVGTAALPFATIYAQNIIGGIVSTSGVSIFNEIPAGIINEVNTTFTINYSPVGNSLQLYSNGLYMSPGGIDYSLSGNSITFVSAPFSGTRLTCNYVI
jgi:hypothetical protein